MVFWLLSYGFQISRLMFSLLLSLFQDLLIVAAVLSPNKGLHFYYAISVKWLFCVKLISIGGTFCMMSLSVKCQKSMKFVLGNYWRRDTYAHMNLREVNEPGLLYNRWNTHENGVQIKHGMEDGNASKYEACEASELHQKPNANVPDITMLTVKAGDTASKSVHKSWADIAEEEEQELLAGKDSIQYFNCWNSDEESNSENIDSNIIYQNLCAEVESAKSRNPSARRSLCFEAGEGTNMTKRNRLQVFCNITPSPDSP